MAPGSPLLVHVVLTWSHATLLSATLRSPERRALADLFPALSGRPEGRISIAATAGAAVLSHTGLLAADTTLAEDEQRTVDLGDGLVLTVHAHRHNPGMFRRREPSRMRWFVLGSALAHVTLAAGSLRPLPSAEETHDARMAAAHGYLLRAELRATEELPPEETTADAKEGGTGTRARGQEGAMGNPGARMTDSRFGVRGPRDNPDPHLARAAALREAAEFGIIGLLNSSAGGDPTAPDAARGRDESLGADPLGARGSLWGGASGDPTDGIGAAGLGLIGAGRAGLGDGATGSAAGHRSSTASRPRRTHEETPQAPGAVRAGEWDDNANYREFRAYMEKNRTQGHHVLDVANRQFLVVRDAQGRGVPGCAVTVASGAARVQLRTGSSGRALLFPRAEGLGAAYTATASCAGQTASASVREPREDGVIKLDLPAPRQLPASRSIDVAFVLDTTGSMSEEIEAVKTTIKQVAATARERQVQVRVGLVEFRDRTDSYTTRVHPFTDDLDAFTRRVSSMNASGGGDLPEAVEEGVNVALSELAWSPDAVARVAFLIGDAPPHLGPPRQDDYAAAMVRASHAGIPLYTIAASGMDADGQLVFRQMAQYTGATSMFVLRGGAGPASTGGGDPRSSCGGTQTGYTSGNLDQLISRKIEHELASIDDDPLRIAGLGRDEQAKPCPARGKTGG